MRLATAGGTASVVEIDSANDVVFDQVYFKAAATVINNVTTIASTATTKAITFNSCVFDGGINGFAATSTTKGVRITNSTFTHNSSYGINITAVLSGLVSQNNYFNSTVTTAVWGMTGNNYSYGDVVDSNIIHGGLYSGAAKFGIGQTVPLSVGTNVIRTLGNSAGKIDYTITDSLGNFRFGIFVYSNSSGVARFSDEYTEPNTALGANLFAYANGTVTCAMTTNTATLRYDIKQFI